jgi:AraC-like DNA-binding protein
MLYREFHPNLLLTPYIETYWTVYGFKSTEEFHNILPDGCIDIIFSFGTHQLGLGSVVPNIVGTTTSFSVGSYSNWVNLVGIRFKPAGFTAFTRTPMYEFTDQRINLDLVESLFDERFYSELPEKELTKEKIQHIDSYLTEKLRYIFEPERQIAYAVDLIRYTKGQLPLTEIASKSCLSLRHFERKFKMAIGISPKSFSKIVKFKYAISYLNKNKNASIFSAAIDCGYYDHAHLIKDFRTLSGQSPSDFRNT